MYKLILSDCELDPDQGTYFITSTDPIFNNFVRDHVYLLDLNWIQADHVGYEYGGYDPYNENNHTYARESHYLLSFQIHS